MTHVSCQAFGAEIETKSGDGHSECSQVGPDNNGARTEASADETVDFSACEHHILFVSQQARSFANNEVPKPSSSEVFGGTSSATASANIQTELQTAGEPRRGILYIGCNFTGEKEYSGTTSAKIVVGSWFSQEVSMVGSSLTFTPDPIRDVQLGTAFQFILESTAVSEPQRQDGESGGQIRSRVALRFVEEDGVTSVAISAAASLQAGA